MKDDSTINMTNALSAMSGLIARQKIIAKSKTRGVHENGILMIKGEKDGKKKFV